jgi:mannan endo-1,6-alpha-mannosidase
VSSDEGFFSTFTNVMEGNSTYSDWAEKTWDWLASTPNLTPSFEVNDGSAIRYNCTDTNHDQWTYNYGTMIMGAAYLYDIVSICAVEIPEYSSSLNFSRREKLSRSGRLA